MNFDAVPQNRITFKTLDTSSKEDFSEMAKLEQRAYGGQVTLTAEQFEQKVAQGAVISAIYSGGKMIGNVVTLIDADPKGEEPILKKLPQESLYADGTSIDPAFRGEGLQKMLLDKRKDLARKLNRETIIGSVRPENGASLRSIISTGGRVLAYSPDYYSSSKNGARLVWETDVTLDSEPKEQIEKKEALNPNSVLEALERAEKKVVLLVQSGEGVDIEAQKAIAKILSAEYVGTGLQSLYIGDGDVQFNGMTFRHLSSFSSKIEKRLRERKQKIQDILHLEVLPPS